MKLLREPETTRRIRQRLLGTLVLGMVGTGIELLLLGHFESVQQQIPLALLAIGTATVAWHAGAPSAASVRALQTVMALCVVAGALGVGLHYQGNVEFELEMYPSMSGVDLVRETMTGATPVLAPGTMALLGLIGLTYAYQHPCAHERAAASNQGDLS